MANEKGTGQSESAAMQRCGVVNGSLEREKVDWNVAPKRVTASYSPETLSSRRVAEVETLLRTWVSKTSNPKYDLKPIE